MPCVGTNIYRIYLESPKVAPDWGMSSYPQGHLEKGMEELNRAKAIYQQLPQTDPDKVEEIDIIYQASRQGDRTTNQRGIYMTSADNLFKQSSDNIQRFRIEGNPPLPKARSI
jgi:hypothetical protein